MADTGSGKTTGKAADTRDLEQVRADIDAIDQQIQTLISRRAECAQRVAAIKLDEINAALERGEPEAEVVYYRPEREAQVLRRIIERNQWPLAGDNMAHVFREIMSACLAQEEPLKVGYLGPEGTFTQSAVFKHFGHSARALPLATIEEVFHEVEAGSADFGVVPIENSTDGRIAMSSGSASRTPPSRTLASLANA